MTDKANEESVKKLMTLVILVTLLVLTFFLLKPILLSIISAFILAFVFTPVYNFINKKIKHKSISAAIVCTVIIILILIPLWFLTPIFVNQSVKFYFSVQQMDFAAVLQSLFPSFFTTDELAKEFGNVLQSFVVKLANQITNSVSDLIINFPVLLLHLSVVLFTFFFSLRDSDKIISYVKSLSPFSKDTEKKLFEYSKGITGSIIYGQILIGILQGLIAGAGFFIFGVPNALFLTLIALVLSIIPVVGPAFVWIPVFVFMFLSGSTVAAIGVLVFGVFSSTIDNILRPLIVSKRTNISSSIILIGMVGGLFLFGILGLIMGPLILAYLLVILEIYRKKDSPTIFENVVHAG